MLLDSKCWKLAIHWDAQQVRERGRQRERERKKLGREGGWREKERVRERERVGGGEKLMTSILIGFML